MKKLIAILVALFLGSAQAATESSPQKELPEAVSVDINRLSAEGDSLAKRHEYAEALASYWKAWDRLPSAKEDWDAGLWLLAAIGDANFLAADFIACRDNLSNAIQFPGAIGNPFLHLRLGQCQFELGDLGRAADELARAFIPEGNAIFRGENPKYLAFIKSKLEAPPEGWPEGWK